MEPFTIGMIVVANLAAGAIVGFFVGYQRGYRRGILEHRRK